MPLPDLALLPFALLAGLLVPRPQGARLVAASFLLASLAVASAGLVLGDGSAAELAMRATGRGVRASYLTANATLLLAGFGLAAVALAGETTVPRPGRTALAALLLVACLLWAAPLLRAGRLVVAVPAALAGVLLLLAVGTWSGERAAAAPSARAEVRAQAGWRGGIFSWGLVSAVLLGLVAPNLGLGLVAVTIALTLLWFAAPERRGLARVPLPLVAALATLVVAGLAWRAAGEDGLGYAGIADAAFSPRLQTWFALALLPSLFVVAGVPPFDRVAPGAALAPLAAVLVARGVAPGLADGVLHWRSAAALWLVLGAADGVRRDRAPVVLACLALFVLLVGGEAARASGLVLALLAAAVELAPRLARRVPPGLGRAALALALVAWALGLRATLAEEVVYSVAFVVVLAGGLLRGAGRPAEVPAAAAA